MRTDYDPYIFKQGIESLECADDPVDRNYILELMLQDIECVLLGEPQQELAKYLAELFLNPEIPVDFIKLNLLHHAFAVCWGSSMQWSVDKEEKIRALERLERSENAKAGADKNKKNAELRKDAVIAWVDDYLGQRISTARPSASDLAKRLLRSVSFQWPDGCKPMTLSPTRKIIAAHLREHHST